MQIVATGTITEYFDSDQAPLMGLPIEDTQGTFTMTLVYDDSAFDSSGDAQIGTYRSAVQAMSVVLGSSTLVGGPARTMTIYDNRTYSQYPVEIWDLWSVLAVRQEPGDAEGQTRFYQLSLGFYTLGQGTAVDPLQSDALVPPPWPFDWTWAGFQYVVGDTNADGYGIGTPAILRGNVENIAVSDSPVPLPATAWLLPAAFAAAGLRARRR